MRKAFIIVGLGFGDEGKGSLSDYICRREDASLVVRYSGGAQCGHNVVMPDGRRHPFAQLGAGTFAEVPTFLASSVIIDPLALAREIDGLSAVGYKVRSNMLTIHPDCVVTTPLHAWWGRRLEEKYGHGSCGMGIGVARKYWIDHGEEAIQAWDLQQAQGTRMIFETKLEMFRQRLLADLSLFESHDYSSFEDAYSRTRTLKGCAGGWLASINKKPIPDGDGPIVFEGAQGILLDQSYGCHPHTTWSEVTPRLAFNICEEFSREWNLSVSTKTVIGVTRAYATRHGSGPLPSEVFDDHAPLGLLIDSGNPYNTWQGTMRRGHFDWPLFRYACSVCHRTGGLDYLAVNCLDEVGDNIGVTDSPHGKFLDLNRMWDSNRQVGYCSKDGFLAALEGESKAKVAILGNGPAYTDKECILEFSSKEGRVVAA